MTWEELAKKAVSGDTADVYALIVAMATALDSAEIKIPEIK
ncbi:hypothetical protein LCGC14_1239490 [marine sediment metagenome]|uniref:Uncharacterized protein n=1 Tax=marine sediment metagenome TaxID=412755 RepID=A0A0F9L6H0_9ZZZZ